MSRNYYVLSNGRIKREQNTLFIEDADGKKKPIPVEDVESLYLYGEVDLNTKLLVFLAQKKIPLHVFNYYGFYSGSYYPREYLHSGYLLVQQVAHYQDPTRRLILARELVRGAAHSLLRNIAYYEHRRGTAEPEREPPGAVGGDTPETPSGIPTDPRAEAAVDAALTVPTLPDPGELLDPLESTIDFSEPLCPLFLLRSVIEDLAARVGDQTDIPNLMGIEGKMRERYYHSWRHILTGDWAFERRVRRPPDNEVNALISFGNGHLYTICLGEIYRTQLTPTISYLHEPGARRFSLALDLAEIFKPLIVDRAIFRLLNTGQLKDTHFDKDMNGCFLTDTGKRLFLGALEDRLKTTIQHRRLGRSVSYRHLIRLECYKLIRHLTGLEDYHAFRAWW
jgi:CRISPR-associated protein Cas1